MQTDHLKKSNFIEALYQRADIYFGSQRSGRYATLSCVVKCIVLLLIYLGAYVYFIFFSRNLSQMLFLAALLGILHVFIPVNISHDAIHQALSPYPWVNKLGLYGFELTGSNSYMYSNKHLEAHFNKENGSKFKAIETQGLLIQKKHPDRTANLPVFIYLFYSQYMIFIRDFMLFFRVQGIIPAKEYLKLYFFKSLYITAFLVLPFIFIQAPWGQILLSLFFMFLIVTGTLVIILLMPTDRSEYARMNDNKSINDRWVIEVLEHNVDFSPGSYSLNFLAGGVNLNVVHYLFPSANHSHYNRLAAIIEATADEYGLHYRKQSVKDVFGIHFNYLKNIRKSSA